MISSLLAVTRIVFLIMMAQLLLSNGYLSRIFMSSMPEMGIFNVWGTLISI